MDTAYETHTNARHSRRGGHSRGRRRSSESTSRGGDRLAQGLGWLSVGLGVAQVAAPRQVARLIGMETDDEHHVLMRALGAREIATGIGILSQQRSPTWLRARVAGDVVDLALLGAVFRSDGVRRTKATAAAAAAVAGITVLDVVASRRLSRASKPGQVAGANAITVTESITIDRPPEDVYAFWRNFQNLPLFMRHLESVEVIDATHSHWTAQAPAGMTVEWDAEVTEDRPNERIAWRSLDGDVPNTGVVRFRRTSGDRGTEVRVELRYAPPGGRMTATLAKLFGEEPGQQVRDDLQAFKQVMETGELPRPGGGVGGARATRSLAEPRTTGRS